MIKDRLFKLHGKSDNDPTRSLIRLMKYFNWSIKDLEELTIPGYLILASEIPKIEKEDKRKGKHGKSRT